MAFRTVTIVGVGLIGGSFGLALRRRGFEGRIVGVSAPERLAAAVERGAVDCGAPLDEAVAAADLVFLAQPIDRLLRELPEVAQAARPGALVTDAGSTKGEIVRRAGELFGDGAQFLGGHPMAGKAGRGVEIADPDLFQGAVWVVSPQRPEELETPPAREFLRWVERFGARPLTISAQEHDQITAWTSHLPQAVSTALAAALAERFPDGAAFEIAGGGLRDTTRLAESAFEVWAPIFRTNAAAVDAALAALTAQLERFRRELRSQDLAVLFERAQLFREKL